MMSQLSSWKARNLLLVSRVTLPISALATISSYAMQTIRIYPSVCVINKVHSCSNVWQVILQVWSIIEKNLIWHVRTSTTTRFWVDHWLPGVYRLSDFASNVVTNEMLEDLVECYATEGQWNFDLIGKILGEDWFLIFTFAKAAEVGMRHDMVA
ncbi:hypothetical protein AHAS_Ahas04G0045000 [Arachis hypogaea]